MTFFDILVVAVTGLLGLRCLMRGFVKEILSFAGLIGAVVLARTHHEAAARVFQPWLDTELQANVAGYAAIGVGTILGASLAAWLIHLIIRRTVLGSLDRLGGCLVGVLQGTLLFGIFLMAAATLTGGLEKTFARGSVLAPHLLGLVKYLSGIVFH